MADGDEAVVPVDPTPVPDPKKSALADLFAGFGDMKPTVGIAPIQALTQITPEEAGIDPGEDEDEEDEDEDEEPGDDEDDDDDEDVEDEDEPALADVLDEVMKGLKKERKAIRQLGGLDEPLRARLMSVLQILERGFDTLAEEAAAAEEEHEQQMPPQLGAGAGAPAGFDAVSVQSALLGAVSLPPFLLKNERAWKQYLAACPSQDRKILTEMVEKIPQLVMQAVEHVAQVTGVAPQQAIEAAGIPFAALQEEVDRQRVSALPEQHDARPQSSSKRGRKGRGR